MKRTSLEIAAGGEALSQAMRAIRKQRGLTANDVALAMGMPLRTFEEFESGRGRITHDRIVAFSEATDSDPFALMLAGALKTASLAIDCADTKLIMILVMHLEEFVERHGSDIVYLEPPNVIGAVERLFRDLTAKLDDREAFLRNWMEGRTGSVGLDVLRRRGVKRVPRKS